jgi:SAM-dependent methyltransferase
LTVPDDPASAYDCVSTEYEHGRPAYSGAAVAHIVDELGLRRGSEVLDLGAGTGKLTRMLVEGGFAVTAVDPSPAMLSKLLAVTPEARVRVGTAEAIPVARGSIDAVTAAQAFHWFDSGRALVEIHDVLRPGGGMALVWNKREDSDPMQALLAELTAPPERAAPRGWQLDVPGLLAASGLFGPVSRSEFGHVHATDPSRLLSRLRSSSYVAALAAERRRAVERQLGEGLERVAPITQIAYTTIVYVARRLEPHGRSRRGPPRANGRAS